MSDKNFDCLLPQPKANPIEHRGYVWKVLWIQLAQVMLHLFINEQVEEEKNAAELVLLVDAMGGSASSFIMLDVQLGKRKAD